MASGCSLLSGPPDDAAASELVATAFEIKAAEKSTCGTTNSGGTGVMTFGIKERVLQRCLVKSGYVKVVSPFEDNEHQFSRYRFTEKGTEAGLGVDRDCQIPMAIPSFDTLTKRETAEDGTLELIYLWQYQPRTDIEVVQCFKHPGLENRGRINGRADDIDELRKGHAVLERVDGSWQVKNLRM